MPLALICAEIEDGKASPTSLQLVTAAMTALPDYRRQIAFVGDDLSSIAAHVVNLPVEQVFLIEHPQLKDGGAGVFDAPVAALLDLCERESPDVVLIARTDYGANVGPRLAFRLDVSPAQDCVDIAADAGTGRLNVTRPVHGGNAMAVYEFTGDGPHVVVIRPGSFDAAEPSGGAAEVIQHDPGGVISEPRARLVDTVTVQAEGVPLQDADIVISGGRGLGGPEAFAGIEELADLLGAAVGASRAACDAGWTDHERQVGLTGKTVTPTLYIAIGISGASQHMAGCSGSRNIVAINNDPDANIFRDARYGIVADWKRALPAFVATVRDLRAG